MAVVEMVVAHAAVEQVGKVVAGPAVPVLLEVDKA